MLIRTFRVAALGAIFFFPGVFFRFFSEVQVSAFHFFSSELGCQGTMRIHQHFATVTLLSATTANVCSVAAFQVVPVSTARRGPSELFSSVGDGGGSPPPPSDDNNGNSWDDFLDPTRKESEGLRRAREYMSENSLPISFDHPNNEEDFEDEGFGDDDLEDSSPPNGDSASSSALVGPPKSGDLLKGGPSKDALARNPYMAVVSKLSPSELISKFTGTAHPRVQNAVRTTILGMIGGLPKLAFDTNTITTGQRLASLMFQLQMTGYMFKNADYRLSLSQSLGVSPDDPSSILLLTGADHEEQDEADEESILNGEVKGKLRIRYKTASAKDQQETDDTGDDGLEMEVDAASYTAELRTEVEQLRDELMTTRKEKEEILRKDLLLYIRTLPEQELRSLTNTMSPDILVAMKGLVQAVMSGIGEGQIGPDTVTEQSGEAMAQLCMWQLAIGYNLRTLEVREEMKKSLGDLNGDASPDENEDGSAQPSFE